MSTRFNNIRNTLNIFDEFLDDFINYATSNNFLVAEVDSVPSITSLAKADIVTATTLPYSVSLDISSHEESSRLTLPSARAVLKDAARQPMSTSLFTELQATARSLNVPGGITVSYYVQQIFDDVVLGNSANRYWNGGAAFATDLGNLSPSSTAGEFRALIGKWFLGTDTPGEASAPGQDSWGASYQTYSIPLFTTAGPKFTDVSQGQIGDCWLLAALAETAIQDSSLISKMIIQHGTTYSVEFWVNGKANFVTVNNALPTYIDGVEQSDGSSMVAANSTSSLWVPLVEKALAQLSEKKGVVTGMRYNSGQNQYYELTDGLGEGISLVTGQRTETLALGGLSSSGLTSVLDHLQIEFDSGEDVLLGTSDQPGIGDLVPAHMFAVTDIDPTAGLVSLYNPWGGNAAGSDKPESFTIAATALEASNAFFYAAFGAPKAG